MTPSSGRARADVELRVPADGAYASVLRTTTAGLAARLDFTIDEIEDLRMAVGEASAMVLAQATPGSDLMCEFLLSPGTLAIALHVHAESAEPPDRDSFAWQVLSTLATEASTEAIPGRFEVTLTMVSELHAGGASSPGRD